MHFIDCGSYSITEAIKILLKPQRPQKPGLYVVQRTAILGGTILCAIKRESGRLYVHGHGLGCLPLCDIEHEALWSNALEIKVQWAAGYDQTPRCPACMTPQFSPPLEKGKVKSPAIPVTRPRL